MLRSLGNLFVRVLTFLAVAFGLWGIDLLLGGDGYDFSGQQVYFLGVLGGLAWVYAAADGPFDA